MRRHFMWVAGLALSVAVLLLASITVAGTEEDVAAINKVRAMEAASLNEGTADHVPTIYSADVEYIPPGEPVMKGAEAVQGWVQGLIDQFDASLEYTGSEVDIAGDWALERYTAKVSMAPKEGGEATVQLVRGIHVYRRGEDGSWKIAHDVWNYVAPEPPPE